MRIEREGGAAAWLVGTLAAPSVQGHRLPPLQELWPCQSLFEHLLAGNLLAVQGTPVFSNTTVQKHQLFGAQLSL